ECIADVHSVRVYDDFAHHPTAIKTTLEGLRARVGEGKIIAIIEPRSNTMRLGTHKESLTSATLAADDVLWYQPPGAEWSMQEVVNGSPVPAKLYDNLDMLMHDALALAEADSHI